MGPRRGWSRGLCPRPGSASWKKVLGGDVAAPPTGLQSGTMRQPSARRVVTRGTRGSRRIAHEVDFPFLGMVAGRWSARSFRCWRAGAPSRLLRYARGRALVKRSPAGGRPSLSKLQLPRRPADNDDALRAGSGSGRRGRTLDDGCHALVYWPTTEEGGDDDDTMGATPSRSALVWGTGPSARTLEPAPLFQWLADLGHVVVVPHSPEARDSGSSTWTRCAATGAQEGLRASARRARGVEGRRLAAPEVSPSTGAVAWVTRGIAGAATSVCRRDAPVAVLLCGRVRGHRRLSRATEVTEVRYYDRWLMGGWIYEAAVKPRCREPEPVVRVPLLSRTVRPPTARSRKSRPSPSALASPSWKRFSGGRSHGPSGWSKHRKACSAMSSRFAGQPREITPAT